MLQALINKDTRFHFIGIGGIGMSGIARILVARGYRVSGSDLVSNKLTKGLSSIGVIISEGHNANLVAESDVVVRSSAVSADNPEMVEALNRGIPILQRAEMLAELMKGYYGIAIAGSHGKTTTASLVTSLLIDAKQDPSYVIGGILNAQKINAHQGTGQSIVVEADESDGSFLHYRPDITIITNIDSDHLQTFGNSIDQLEEAFFDFMNCTKPDGHIIVCVDDPRLMRLAERSTRHVITYSTRLESADYYAAEIEVKDAKSFFTLFDRHQSPKAYQLNLPGHHNVANALSCIAVARLMQIDETVLHQSLQRFEGVGRRFQLYSAGKRILIDDYGHHPKEIEATLEAAKLNWPHRRLVLVFQPHRYTRTKALFNDFVSVLGRADELVLLDVYAACESKIPGADSDALANAVSHSSPCNVFRVKDLHDLIKHSHEHFKPDDVIIMQGAGDIGGMVQSVADALQSTVDVLHVAAG